MYGFILNMWVMNKIDEDFLDAQVVRGRLTQEEKLMIMATPRI